MQESKIEWTDITWNPVRGCTEISPGCDHCYARVFAERFRGTEGHAFEQGFDLRLAPHKLIDPLQKAQPKRIFVNSMSDLFHKNVPHEYIEDVLDVMNAAKWHTYQILTKRSSRLRNFVNRHPEEAASSPHIWWGVSVEDKKHGLPRIRHLQEMTEARVKWLSIEPLIEDLGTLDLHGISAVVVGGESGPGARPMEEAWVQPILEQCKEQKVKFFFKQWGGVNKKQTGRTLNDRLYNEQPKRVENPVASPKERKEMIASVSERVRYWLSRDDLGELVFHKDDDEEEPVQGRVPLETLF
jgi:protein gp37